MQRTVAVETGEVLPPRAAGVGGVEDGVAVAEGSCVGTDERKEKLEATICLAVIYIACD